MFRKISSKVIEKRLKNYWLIQLYLFFKNAFKGKCYIGNSIISGFTLYALYESCKAFMRITTWPFLVYMSEAATIFHAISCRFTSTLVSFTRKMAGLCEGFYHYASIAKSKTQDNQDLDVRKYAIIFHIF